MPSASTYSSSVMVRNAPSRMIWKRCSSTTQPIMARSRRVSPSWAAKAVLYSAVGMRSPLLVYPDQHQYYTTNRRRFARFFLFFLFYAVTTIAKTINASTAAMPMTSVTSIPLIHTSLEDYKKKPATRNEPPARSFPSPAGESLILTVDRGVVSSESRVKETLKSAGFLYSHGELRGRRGVESIPRVRRDCDDIAAGLLARGVTVHSESEATSLILLLIIHVCFLLFSQHAFGIPYQHLDYRRRGPSVHESAELFFTSAPGKSPLDSSLRALSWKVYRGGSWSFV